MLLFDGVSKLGAFVRGGAEGRSSGTPNDMMSTILDTSFAIFSGTLAGSCFPTSLRLHRYMARANSGKRSCPDFVVSDRTLAQSVYYRKAGVVSIPYLHQVAPRQFGPHEEVFDLFTCDLSARVFLLGFPYVNTIQSLSISDC